MKVKLTLEDRILLPVMLPTQASYTDLLLRNEIMKLVELNSAEVEQFKVKQDGGNITWDKDVKNTWNYELTDSQSDLIRRKLVELEKAKQLTINHLNLYRMFVAQPETEDVDKSSPEAEK